MMGISIGGPDNIIYGNTIRGNENGIYNAEHTGPERTTEETNNIFYHNNFIDNIYNHISYNFGLEYNIWDNGYPSGGNYWDNYTGIDTNHDGIGDTPYVINNDNIDRYPLMGIFHSYETPTEKRVNIVTNSTIDYFEFCEPCGYIRILVSNKTDDQEYGFCRITIPHGLIPTPYVVVISGTSPVYSNYTLYDNGTHRWIYFEYEHSTREIFIVPEFSELIVLPLFLMTTVLVILIRKKKQI